MRKILGVLMIVFIALILLASPVYATNWLNQNAIEVDLVNWQSADCKILDGFKEAIADKRIVFLGEPDHYVKELYSYRLLMIKCLQEAGWKTVGLEMGRSDGSRINEFIQTSDGTMLSTVARLGNVDSILERDLPTRTFGSGQTGVSPLIASDTKFFKDLEKLKVDRFFGYDIDILPGGGFADAKKLIAASLIEKPSKDLLLKILNAERGGPYSSDYDRINQGLMHLGEIKNNQDVAEIRSTLIALKESLQFAEKIYHLPNIREWEEKESKNWLEVSTKRETTMFWQVDEALKLNPNEKIILLGHNLHLAKDSHSIFQDNELKMPGYWFALGTYLAEKYKDDVFSVWMLYAAGERSSGPECPSSTCPILKDSNTVNSYLAQNLSSPSLVPLWNGNLPLELNQESRFLFNGYNILRTNISEQADAIFFVPQVSGL